MRVLVGVDDSAESRDAVAVAFEFFGPDAEYTIASIGKRGSTPGVIFAAGYPGNVYTKASELAEEFGVAEAEALAVSAEQILPPDAEVAIEGELGHVGVQLCRLAEDEPSNVVVIGSHDKSVWQRLLDPSVGRYLIDNAPCPVLVVR